MTQAVAAATQAVLLELTQNADAVLLTCSTLGPAADALADSAIPILRVDTALARAAVRQGGFVAVLRAVATTVEPTRLLFEAAARATGATQIALAQASMSAAGHSRAGPPLLTSPTAGHQAILSRCPDQSRFQERRRTVTPHDSP